MRTIFKREFSAFFRSPVAYVVIGMFEILTGIFFWLYNIRNGYAYFGATLNALSLFLIFFLLPSAKNASISPVRT